MPLEIRRFEDPDQVHPFELGQLDILRAGGLTIGRARYEPGWRWSTHIGAANGERYCRVAHVGLVLAGRNLIEMEDGRRVELQPGDVFVIGPEPHDSSVLGDTPYESLHLAGVEAYAPGPETPETRT